MNPANSKMKAMVKPVTDLLHRVLKLEVVESYAGNEDHSIFGYIICVKSPTFDIFCRTYLTSLGIPKYIFGDYLFDQTDEWNPNSNVIFTKLKVPRTSGKMIEELAQIWLTFEIFTRNFITSKREWKGNYLIRYNSNGAIKYMMTELMTPRLFTLQEAIQYCKHSSSSMRIVPNVAEKYGLGDPITYEEYAIEKHISTVKAVDNILYAVDDVTGERVEMKDLVNNAKYRIL